MKVRFLIVDDTKFMRRMLTDMMEKMDYDVVGEAENGASAIEMYRQLRPDVTFMDIYMPGMDGIEAMRQIRAIHPNAIVIVCSGTSQQYLISEAMKLGADGYVMKPFNPKQIKEVINKYVLPKLAASRAGLEESSAAFDSAGMEAAANESVAGGGVAVAVEEAPLLEPVTAVEEESVQADDGGLADVQLEVAASYEDWISVSRVEDSESAVGIAEPEQSADLPVFGDGGHTVVLDHSPLMEAILTEDPEPELQAQPEPELELASDLEFVSASETETAVETEWVSDVDTESESDALPEIVVETLDLLSEQVSEAEVAEAAIEIEFNPEPESEPESEPEPESNSEPEPAPVPVPAPVLASVAALDPEPVRASIPNVVAFTPVGKEASGVKEFISTISCQWKEDIQNREMKYSVVCHEGEPYVHIDTSIEGQSIVFSFDGLRNLLNWVEKRANNS